MAPALEFDLRLGTTRLRRCGGSAPYREAPWEPSVACLIGIAAVIAIVTRVPNKISKIRSSGRERIGPVDGTRTRIIRVAQLRRRFGLNAVKIERRIIAPRIVVRNAS